MSKFIVSISPHLRDKTTTQSIMLDVLIALCPVLIAGVVIFGLHSAVAGGHRRDFRRRGGQTALRRPWRCG